MKHSWQRHLITSGSNIYGRSKTSVPSNILAGLGDSIRQHMVWVQGPFFLRPLLCWPRYSSRLSPFFHAPLDDFGGGGCSRGLGGEAEGNVSDACSEARVCRNRCSSVMAEAAMGLELAHFSKKEHTQVRRLQNYNTRKKLA